MIIEKSHVMGLLDLVRQGMELNSQKNQEAQEANQQLANALLRIKALEREVYELTHTGCHCPDHMRDHP